MIKAFRKGYLPERMRLLVLANLLLIPSLLGGTIYLDWKDEKLKQEAKQEAYRIADTNGDGILQTSTELIPMYKEMGLLDSTRVIPESELGRKIEPRDYHFRRYVEARRK